ncbi:MAG: transposase [Deltaproteobacteria bacterium]|nr:transposase [Deltaproteobacteria bacterium]
MSPRTLFPEISKFLFYPEIKFCPQCGIKLNVLKTRERTVITMNTGPFIVHETILYCPKHGGIHRSEDLQSLVPFKGTYGYDVLVHVGKALYLRTMNEQTIKKELKLKAINISESGIRYLGQKFIAYLTICHQQSQLKLRLKMARNGGYILHIDGTCEGDSPHLFTGMDEISGIILSSVKINSEKKEKIIPFLKDIQAKYGTPLAIVSDMGKGLIGAVEEVFPGILFFICHFHFLRDIGKDLLGDKYRDLRNRLTKSKIRGALRSKAKDFEKKLGKEMKALSKVGANPELAAIKTALLHIYWMFDTSSLSGYGFPFDMKHFLFYLRLIAGYEKIKQLYDITGCKPFYQLIKILSRIVNDTDLKETASFLEENEIVFNELREALRITLKDSKQGLNDEGEDCDMKSISDKVAEFTEKYNLSKNKYHQKMIEQIEKYYEKLFADPIKVMISGKEVLIQPQRTNNVMEQFFRYLKRLLRKKSGNISVKRSLTAMLPGTVLIKNLNNEEYLELLLDGNSSLEERFAQVDSRLFLREFSEMKLHNRKIPVDAKKLIKKEKMPEEIEKLFLAAAN